MKKIFNIAMLALLIGSQISGLTSGLVLYASEVSTDQTEDVSESEVIESEETSEAISEETSEAISEETSETISEEIVDNEVETSKVESAAQSEGVEEVAIEITSATVKIDDDGAVTETQRALPSAFLASSELENDENLTNFENETRIEENSGESSITIEPSKKQRSQALIDDLEVYYVLDQDGEVVSGSTEEPEDYDGNLVTTYNGEIVGSDNAIARTSGGYETTFYIYDSIANLKSETDGVPISGGGFDATYIETVYQDGVYYDHIKISGYEGYTEAGNVQIIPEELIQARSYYAVEDENWVYYSAIDPLVSTEYDRMVIDAAPTSAVSDVQYYSDDDLTYYTESIITPQATAAISYNTYFQNLPFRSESSYTATDYKNYLKAKGKTSSEYYSETSAFTKAQSLESVNSLLIFAMANHESAYGTSTYAKACYNFFGRGAIDSDPDQACKYYSYNTATDGILAQTLFLQNGYFDILDWRYSGTHVGNKASGLNVKYASDVDWGKKISNHAYMMDQYMGGKEEDKYAILEVSGTSNVYTTGSLATKVKSSGDSGSYSSYDLSANTGTSNTINVVALTQDSDAYQIYVPTAVKNSSSVDCSYTNSKMGSYPNYGGRNSVSVATNTANYACDYVSFANNKYWISKSNTKQINSTAIPYTTTNIYEYYSNGKTKAKFVVNSATNEIKYAYKYDQDGNIINKFTYISGTKYGDNHSKKHKTIFYVKNGRVTQARTYATNQKVKYIYQYYTGATLSNYTSKIKYRYNMDTSTGYLIDSYVYTEGSARKRFRIYTYNSKTKFSERSSKRKYRYDLKAGTTTITRAYRYDSSGNFDRIYTYTSGTKYGQKLSPRFNNVFYVKGSKRELMYSIKYKSGKKYSKFTYYNKTYFGKSHGSRIKTRYYY